MSEITIRAARPADARGIARLDVETWRATYAGVLSSSYLVGLSERRREAGSTRLIIRLTRRERPQTLTSARAALSGIFSVYSANVPQPFHLIHLHVYLVEVSR